jgi:DNA polymerase III sliding clamp (beta) subunit (PCNA family)
MQANAPVVESKKTRDGVAFVEARSACQKCEVMPEGVLLVELTPGGKLSVKHREKARSFMLPTASGTGYPPIQWGDDAPELFRVSGLTFASLIASVSWCSGGGETDPMNGSVRIFLTGDALVAESFYRFACARVTMPLDRPAHVDVPIMVRCVNEMVDLARTIGEDEIVFKATDTHAYLETFAQRIGAAIPAVAKIPYELIEQDLGQRAHQEIVLPKTDLQDAVRSVGLATDRGRESVTLVLVPGEVHVVADSSAEGAGRDMLPTASPIASPQAVTMNIPMLLALCKATQGADVSISIVAADDKPAAFTDVRAWSRMTAYIMPIKPNRNAVVDALLVSAGGKARKVAVEDLPAAEATP